MRESKEMARARLIEDMERIVALIKENGDAMPSAKVAKMLGMSSARPGFVAGRFPMTLSSEKPNHKAPNEIDLHPNIWAHIRAGVA